MNGKSLAASCLAISLALLAAGAPRALSVETTPDYFCGKFQNLGGYFPHAKDQQHVEIVKEGNEYRLIGTKSYDTYRFVKVEDGVLEDKDKHLGKIHMGTTTFKGLDMKMRILKVDFCYNSFLLLPMDGRTRWISSGFQR